MKNKKNQKLNSILLIIIIILLLFIIYFLFKNTNNKPLKPSGNIDIFEIICNDNCNCWEIDPVFKDEYFKENFDVSENNISWESTNNLNIFQNPMYEMENKIAPESTNFYQFVIKNNTIYDVNYEMNFKEENKYHINMKYRLVKNDKYIVGDDKTWVTYQELNQQNIFLTKKKFDTYYLEWKWFSSDNDTEIGESEGANYSLSINIKAVGRDS